MASNHSEARKIININCQNQLAIQIKKLRDNKLTPIGTHISWSRAYGHTMKKDKYSTRSTLMYKELVEDHKGIAAQF